MRTTKSLLALLMCIVLLLGLFGCGTKAPAESAPADQPIAEAPAEPPAEEPAAAPEEPAEVPAEPPVSDLYTQAAEALRNAQNLTVDLTTVKTISAEPESFELASEQQLVLTGIGTDTFAANLQEELKIDDFSDEFAEHYENGILYLNVYNTGRFQGEMTEADFLARFAPAVLLDETLYADVSANETDTGTTLTFSDPTGPESWALPAGAEFVRASGTAEISADGTLTQTSYTIEYTQGGFNFTVEISSEATLCDNTALEALSDADLYLAIDSVLAPRLYDTAILYLLSAETASSSLAQTIVSQAAGCVLTEQTDMKHTGSGQDYSAEISYDVSITDATMAAETYSQTETYKDGLYTFSADGSEPEPDPGITPEDMITYLMEYYGYNLPSVDYFLSATAEEVSGLIYLEMELNEDWGEDAAADASYTLFQDENFLNQFASAYQTTAGSYYMVLDPITGFPISAGTTFSGIHTIEGMDCILSSEISQTYRLADLNTREALIGESEPTEQATPLLYHVTGADGQEMYLMGTIHVGDNRTGFLPDEVYAAFNASDALAVEADVTSLEDEMAADPALAVQLAQLCINPNNGSTQDLLSEELYGKAVQLLKASGNYSSNLDYMKPYMWCNTIENFYVSLSRLTSDQGMDMRLLELAKEQEKPILEVESVLEQFEMLMNFSTDLQILLLEDAVSCTAAEYCADVEELYALWCAGDEAVLREMLNAEDAETDMTEEELALSQEYLDAMIIDRNEGMLDVAISYLESGDTVFYAVGLAHLLQENGLVDTLRDAGYTVEQVLYS